MQPWGQASAWAQQAARSMAQVLSASDPPIRLLGCLSRQASSSALGRALARPTAARPTAQASKTCPDGLARQAKASAAAKVQALRSPDKRLMQPGGNIQCEA